MYQQLDVTMNIKNVTFKSRCDINAIQLFLIENRHQLYYPLSSVTEVTHETLCNGFVLYNTSCRSMYACFSVLFVCCDWLEVITLVLVIREPVYNDDAFQFSNISNFDVSSFSVLRYSLGKKRKRTLNKVLTNWCPTSLCCKRKE